LSKNDIKLNPFACIGQSRNILKAKNALLCTPYAILFRLKN